MLFDRRLFWVRCCSLAIASLFIFFQCATPVTLAGTNLSVPADQNFKAPENDSSKPAVPADQVKPLADSAWIEGKGPGVVPLPSDSTNSATGSLSMLVTGAASNGVGSLVGNANPLKVESAVSVANASLGFTPTADNAGGLSLSDLAASMEAELTRAKALAALASNQPNTLTSSPVTPAVRETTEYTFEQAVDYLTKDYAAAVIVSSLTADDLRKLAEQNVEIGIAVICGKIVLFTSAGRDELRVNPVARDLLAESSIIIHTHPAGLGTKPSSLDYDMAGSAVEYLISSAGVYAYNHEGLVSDNPIDANDLVELLKAAQAPLASTVEARQVLNTFIAAIDQYNTRPDEATIFREGNAPLGVVTDSLTLNKDNTFSYSADWTGLSLGYVVSEYRYSICPTDGGAYLVSQQSTSTNTSLARNDLNFESNKAYSLYVEAKNALGVWSMVAKKVFYHAAVREYYVDPNSTNPTGSLSNPFSSLEQARDAIRAIKPATIEGQIDRREGAHAVSGGALYLDGKTSIDLGNPPDLSITGSQTISLWIKPENFNVRQNLYGKAYGGEGAITLEGDGTLTYYYGTSGANTPPNWSISSGQSIPLGQWTHVVIVRDLDNEGNKNLTWYINGARSNWDRARVFTNATASDLDGYIGKGYAGYYTGGLDEMRLYGAALTADQVKELCNHPDQEGPTEKLVGHWKFDEAGGAAVYNSAPGKIVPFKGATVYLKGGDYYQPETLTFTPRDSGLEGAPIVYKAYNNEEVRFTGAKQLDGFSAIDASSSVYNRLDANAKERVQQINLFDMGLTSADFGALQKTGFGTPAPDPSSRSLELFFGGERMTLARWPNTDWAYIAGTADGKTRFNYSDERPEGWANTDDVWMYGHWAYDCYDMHQKISSLNKDTNEIVVTDPQAYGFQKGMWYYYENVVEELDKPGEWYLDRKTGILYFWPPADAPAGSKAEVSVLSNNFIDGNVSNITLEGLTFEGVRGSGIRLQGDNNLIKSCDIYDVGTDAVTISGNSNGIINSRIHDVGGNAIQVTGGDRVTLTRGDNYVNNNEIYNVGQWTPMGSAGIKLYGVGNTVSHNSIHDVPHMAIYFNGNDHLIEYNKIENAVTEAQDAGAIYGGGDWSQRGTIIRYNYFKNITGINGTAGCNGVYIDDGGSGITVLGNIFYNVKTRADGEAGVIFISGGRDNLVKNNVFISSPNAVHVDARGLGCDLPHLVVPA